MDVSRNSVKTRREDKRDGRRKIKKHEQTYLGEVDSKAAAAEKKKKTVVKRI